MFLGEIYLKCKDTNLNSIFTAYLKQKMNRIVFAAIIIALVTSCGAVLQNSGLKNYQPKQKITEENLNDYQYDFIYLTKLVEEGYPLLDSVYPKEIRQNQETQIVTHLASVDNNTDFIIQVRKYLSTLKNQHTSAFIAQKDQTLYPYHVYISYDDWHLLNISTEYDSLLIGEKITEINGVPVSEIEKELIDYTFAENKINQQFELRRQNFYNKPKYLMEIGVISKLSDPLLLRFENNEKIEISPVTDETDITYFDISFKANPITKNKDKTYDYTIDKKQNYGYLQFNRLHDKIDIENAIGSYVKPWLQPMARAYVKRQFKKDKPSKQIADFYNPQYPVFKDFVWELIDSLNDNHVENLIIDLRNNPGGNYTLGVQLLYFLSDSEDLIGFKEYVFTSDISKEYFEEEFENLKKKYPEGVPERDLVLLESHENLMDEITDKNSNYFIPKNRPIFSGNIYILSNYRTGSAAAMLTTLFQDNGLATVIGTSVGNNPTGPTTYTPMVLPKTKSKVSIATSYLERPVKANGKIQIPDIWVEYTISDLIDGKDPFLEAALQQIKDKANK